MVEMGEDNNLLKKQWNDLEAMLGGIGLIKGVVPVLFKWYDWIKKEELLGETICLGQDQDKDNERFYLSNNAKTT